MHTLAFIRKMWAHGLLCRLWVKRRILCRLTNLEGCSLDGVRAPGLYRSRCGSGSKSRHKAYVTESLFQLFAQVFLEFAKVSFFLAKDSRKILLDCIYMIERRPALRRSPDPCLSMHSSRFGLLTLVIWLGHESVC